MKSIKFYAIIILIILILIFSFANIASNVRFYMLFTTFTFPLTIPMLMLAFVGMILGWILYSYVQETKKEKEAEELDSGDESIDTNEEKEDEVIEDES